jgi:polar amino acid transport system substrate-binding protein
VVSGKIDVILASMFDTEERRKRIDFSEPYFEQDSYAFTVKANTAAAGAAQSAPAAPAGTELLASVDDLKDKRIAVQLGHRLRHLRHRRRFPTRRSCQYPVHRKSRCR